MEREATWTHAPWTSKEEWLEDLCQVLILPWGVWRMICQHRGLSMLSDFTLDCDLAHFPVSLGLENEGYVDDLSRAGLVHASSSDPLIMKQCSFLSPYYLTVTTVAKDCHEFIFGREWSARDEPLKERSTC